jgi:26S proteasome regulatory subunit N9
METLSPEIVELYQHRLWHELAEALLQLPGAQVAAIWDSLKQFSDNLNQVKLAQLGILAIEGTDPLASISFLREISTSDKPASLLLRIQIGRLTLLCGNLLEAQSILEEVQKDVENLPDLDSILYSHLYGALAELYRQKNNPELFYRFSLQYLAYTPPAEVSNPQQLAADLATAVLVAETIHNFGELIEQAVFKSLQNTENQWIYELLILCNEGRVKELQERAHALPPVLQNPVLLQKVRILALMEHVLRTNHWELTFQEIAHIMNAQVSEVEWMLMKAMALELIRGEIDEVSGVVKISWLQPRVLDHERLELLQKRLGLWRGTISNVLNHLESEAKELIE